MVLTPESPNPAPSTANYFDAALVTVLTLHFKLHLMLISVCTALPWLLPVLELLAQTNLLHVSSFLFPIPALTMKFLP